MGLYDDASLVMIPSGYKDGKLYSVKPSDGSGDFTFSRGSNLSATRVNEDGLIEKGRENLLLQSNNFSSGYWNYRAGDSSTGGQSGYDGSSDAWLLNVTNGGWSVYQNYVATGVYTFSLYVKAGTIDVIQIDLFSSSTTYYGQFNLTSGTDAGGSNTIDRTITDVGGGWYRISISANVSSILYARIGTVVQTGNFYIQDAQLEVGLVATDYIETGATTAQAGILEDLPRIDYSGGASCPALLLEPQRTNLLSHSEYALGLPQYNSPTIVQNDEVSPEGVQNAFEFTTDAASFRGVRPTLSITPNGAYTASWFVKKRTSPVTAYCGFGFDFNGGTSRKINYIAFDEYNGTAIILQDQTNNTTTDVIDYGDYYRFIATSTDTGSNTSLQFTPYPTISPNGISINTAANTIVAYGLQLEAGSYPTSYIPTYGSSVTRSADACNTGNLLSLFDDSQGVLFAEFNPSFPEVSSRQITINDTSYSNRIIIEVRESGTKIRAFVTSGGSSEFESTKNISVVDTTYKVALKYSATDTAFFVNGEKISSATGTISMPTGLKHLSFTGRYNDNGLAFESRTKQLAYFPTALTDSECIALTTL